MKNTEESSSLIKNGKLDKNNDCDFDITQRKDFPDELPSDYSPDKKFQEIKRNSFESNSVTLEGGIKDIISPAEDAKSNIDVDLMKKNPNSPINKTKGLRQSTNASKIKSSKSAKKPKRKIVKEVTTSLLDEQEILKKYG